MKQAKGKSYALRIEAGLVEPLQKLKKQNRRSLNAEINAALQQWVGGASTPAAKAKGAVKAPTAAAKTTPPAAVKASDASKPVAAAAVAKASKVAKSASRAAATKGAGKKSQKPKKEAAAAPSRGNSR